MSFTRDDIAAYDKQPAKFVEKFDPFNPTAEVAAEPTPEVKPEPEVEASATEDTPTVDTVNDGSPAEIEVETATTDSATPESDSTTQETEAANEGSPRTGGSARERIAELVEERNALRKYGEYLLERLKTDTGKPATATAPAQAAPKEDPAPTLEQHNFDPVAFAKAQTEWMERQVDRRVQSAVKNLEVQQQEQAIQQTFWQRTEAFKKDKADFDVVLANPALPSLAQSTARAILKSELGPAVAYHLAKNPDLATRIARMDPDAQKVAIGRIEGQLSAPAPAPAKPAVVKRTVTQAPPPPKPVAASAPVEKDQSVMSMDEWVAKERSRKVADAEEKRRTREAMRRR